MLSWSAAGLVTGLLAALIDTIDTAASGFEGQLAFYAWYATSSLALGLGLLGAVLGAWVQGARWVGRLLPGRVGSAVKVVLIALPCAAFVAWVPTSWIVEHWRELDATGKLIARGVYVAAFVGSVVLAAVVLRIYRSYRTATPRLPRLNPLWLVGSAVLATASYLADRWVLVGLYDDFHYGLAGSFLACFAAFWILALLTASKRRPELAELLGRLERPLYPLAALLCALVALVTVERLSPDVFGPGRAPLFPKLLRTVRSHTDFDRDGLSSLFGGSDCAPFNPRIRPGMFDMPGNRVDEDCTGSDSRWPKPSPRVKYPVPRLGGYNVLLITVDAFRADHIGAYGYEKNPTTPNIDRLAQRSLRFAEAFSPSPKTMRTMPSLATGLYPSNVPRDYGNMTGGSGGKPRLAPLSSETKVMAEVLKAEGYQTYAVHGVPLRGLGLTRGFDEYVASREATATALRFLDERARAQSAQPFFMWLHYYSPHHTYEKREGFDFGDDDVSRYDSEIAFDDHQIGLLLEQLDRRGLRDKTIVFLTADHGEEFRDHGGTQHGFTLYRELTHVPLILFLPGTSPAVVDAPVELVDIYPTLCELLRLRKCSPNDGESLLAAAAGKRSPERGAYCELHTRGEMPSMNALFDGRYRLIYNYELDRAELYDARTDRAEQHNIAAAEPEVGRRMRERLALRPIENQARIIADYLKTKDANELVAALPRMRHPRLLRFALDKLGTEMKPSYVGDLQKLRRRVGLPREVRRAIDGLIRKSQGSR